MKNYLTIGKVAKLLNRSQPSVDLYVFKGLLPKPTYHGSLRIKLWSEADILTAIPKIKEFQENHSNGGRPMTDLIYGENRNNEIYRNVIHVINAVFSGSRIN